MSSTLITTLYNAFIARIKAKLMAKDGWNRLSNPYALEDNSAVFLKQGFGIKLGEARNRGQVTCNMMIERTFDVVLTREVFKTENDAEGISGVELQLMEDLRTIVQDFETSDKLSNGKGSTAYVSDGGVQHVYGNDNVMYLAVEAKFTVILIENYNS